MVATPRTPSINPLKKAGDSSGKGLPDKESGLTREESARLLGVSVQAIKYYEKKELLRPQQVSRTINGREQVIVVHDPQALAALDRTLKAKIKATATTDTSGWLTRNQSIGMLRVSAQTLKNYENQGKLHPIRARREDARGYEQSVVVYDPKELAKLPRGVGRLTPREAGEIEGLCFEMFEQGKSFREIVIALRQTSDRVHELHERWLDDGGSFIVISDVSRKALEALLGPFTDVTELIELITAKLGGKPSLPSPLIEPG
jgi:hypothetical protein